MNIRVTFQNHVHPSLTVILQNSVSLWEKFRAETVEINCTIVKAKRFTVIIYYAREYPIVFQLPDK